MLLRGLAKDMRPEKSSLLRMASMDGLPAKKSCSRARLNQS